MDSLYLSTQLNRTRNNQYDAGQVPMDANRIGFLVRWSLVSVTRTLEAESRMTETMHSQVSKARTGQRQIRFRSPSLCRTRTHTLVRANNIHINSSFTVCTATAGELEIICVVCSLSLASTLARSARVLHVAAAVSFATHIKARTESQQRRIAVSAHRHDAYH